VCFQNAVDKGMGLGPERRVEMAFSRRAEQFRKAGIRYEMDEMRGRMCLCDRGQIVRNVIKKDDGGLHALGKAANSAALEASIRDNGEGNVLLCEARLALGLCFKRHIGEDDNLRPLRQGCERFCRARHSDESPGRGGEKRFEQFRHFGWGNGFVRAAPLDVAGQRKALKVEPEILRFEVTLKPRDELEQHLIRIGNDERAAPFKFQRLNLRDDPFINGEGVGGGLPVGAHVHSTTSPPGRARRARAGSSGRSSSASQKARRRASSASMKSRMPPSSSGSPARARNSSVERPESAMKSPSRSSSAAIWPRARIASIS